tara:strand:- start:6648 stop:7208 length:561 start_codon:yes stop_codon:yes gene_type:complete
MISNKSKYVILLLKHIFIILTFFSLNFSYAQDVYRTQNGNILITTILSDSIFKLSSKEVIILLNNNQATFNMTIYKSTFVTDNKIVNDEIALLKLDEIVFSGELDIDNIDNQDHTPLDFIVTGIISTNNKTLIGKGRLEHISSEGNISCLLSLKFNLSIDDLGLNLEGLDLSDEVQIDVVQVLLNN